MCVCTRDPNRHADLVVQRWWAGGAKGAEADLSYIGMIIYSFGREDDVPNFRLFFRGLWDDEKNYTPF